MSVKIKKGDTVRVITGKDKGKEGKVLVTDVASQRVVVEGVNMVTKHQKPNGMNQGGIVHQEAPIHVSNVVLVHDGKPTRVAFATRDVRELDKGLEVSAGLGARTFGLPWFKHFRPEIIDEYIAAFRKVIEKHEELLPGDPGNPADLGKWFAF